MDLEHFGDSYDLVKKSLLTWLKPFGDWSAFPMFTHHVEPADADRFSRFLSVPLISIDTIDIRTDRHPYFRQFLGAGNLFLDPNKGLKIGRGRKPEYVYGDEIRLLSEQRPKSLTMIFDQSFDRTKGVALFDSAKFQVREKLDWFAANQMSGFAYISHAAFVVVSHDRDLITSAYETLIDSSDLPKSRFIVV